MPEPVLPYGRQAIDDEDIAAVVRILKADLVTTGPEVAAFESDLAATTSGSHAAVLNSGTSALHAAYAAIGIGTGDEVVMSPLTFAATANAALYLGARPVFVDVDSDTGLIDPAAVDAAVTSRTRAIVSVDYAGLPVDYSALSRIAQRHGVPVIADAAHSLGASDAGRLVGTLADATTFSFHPVKAITTGEGGAVVTNDATLHGRVITFRAHGMVTDRARLTHDEGPWYMEMQSLGFNYRMTDIQCALGRSQLTKLPAFLARRRAIAARYDRELRNVSGIELPKGREGAESAWHLYVVRVHESSRRRPFFEALRSRGIGVQVHYLPVYRHPYYEELGYPKALCPIAEDFYARAVSIPIHPRLTETDVARVVDAVATVASEVLA
jgi:UDP-4-amino-4,6-dideoxy-N-acetyl-beta-L-altrosamine transaminase